MFQLSLPWRSDVLRFRRLLSITVALLSTLVLTAPADASPAARQAALAPCANTELAPTAANGAQMRTAILCLHNQIRAQNRLPLLKVNAKLGRAALGHSADMVAASFFDHTGSTGATLIDRLKSARYMRRGQDWVAGENLAWGTGTLATPTGIMNAWMNSAGHRVNILRRSYRELGIGISTGPRPAPPRAPPSPPTSAPTSRRRALGLECPRRRRTFLM